MSTRAGRMRRVRFPQAGFTLIEILVVLVISIGLVITMALLFRAVAHTALLLRGSNVEWTLQTRMREQLRHLLVLPGETPLLGDPKNVTFTTWQSQKNGLSGRPVVAQYRYEANDRVVYYRESDLPAWWHQPPRFAELRSLLARVPETRLSTGVDNLSFRFVAASASDLNPANQQTIWQQADLPKFMLLSFSRAERPYSLYLETRGLAAQTLAQE